MIVELIRKVGAFRIHAVIREKSTHTRTILMWSWASLRRPSRRTCQRRRNNKPETLGKYESNEKRVLAIRDGDGGCVGFRGNLTMPPMAKCS